MTWSTIRQFLSRLVAEGRLRGPTAPAVARSLTVHDSCYLTRYNGVIGETREVLRAVPGFELREMERNGKQTFCCGAGGGRMWMEEQRGTRINAERTRQALSTGADDRGHGLPVLPGHDARRRRRRGIARARA
jgi:Fe-S oxidoreductase